MIPSVHQELGYPWWLVHRAHLHQGLVDVARKYGASLVMNVWVNYIDYNSDGPVKVRTESGKEYTFDLLIGSDGLNSVVRRTILPHVQPKSPTTNCAYLAIVPYAHIRKDPVAKELIDKLTMEVGMAENAYNIAYPISAGKDFNIVLSHHRDSPVDKVEEIDMDDSQNT